MDAFISAFLENLSQGNFQQLAADFASHYATLVSKAGGILPAETLGRLDEVFMEGNLQAVVNMIQEVFSAAESAVLEVAVIGESGTGKSSFINVLRGLGHDDEGAADVGVVETTMKKTPYQHPKYPNVTFWDLPGTGTPKFSPDTYLEKVGCASFDFFIIVSSSRFSLHDALLAQKIKALGKKFYFVRTKVDRDLYNKQEAKPQSFKRERVLQHIRDYCLANLSDIRAPDPRVFLVSNFDLHDFDFPSLEKTLLAELPAHKRQVFVLMLPTLSDATVELKRAFLRGKIWLEAVRSSASALVPFAPLVKGFDLHEQEALLKLYRRYFGLDDESLKEIAEKLGTSVQDIKGYTKCLDFWSLVEDDSAGARAMSCVETFCSVNGGVPSVVCQFLKTLFLLWKFLDAVADDAKLLLHKIISAEV
ncbi:T-cell-specific guanine nucleotide triphosphate-binding protein 2 [Fukomys damarensis]|uniref:T-cell-specific guanine nucleotide triphosphate-binding protein 2 n=1 Tax=Fukomys damarensis TaxID=885580 RepID=UPI00053F7621|nr:T-cell-specific guanine nucleotide triphosphate-binding protein 2 [Fukomys damarensis]